MELARDWRMKRPHIIIFTFLILGSDYLRWAKTIIFINEIGIRAKKVSHGFAEAEGT
jgi:hypothetical protein